VHIAGSGAGWRRLWAVVMCSGEADLVTANEEQPPLASNRMRRHLRALTGIEPCADPTCV
jgi:hypothetical protein